MKLETRQAPKVIKSFRNCFIIFKSVMENLGLKNLTSPLFSSHVINDLAGSRKRKPIDIDYCAFSHSMPMPQLYSERELISKYALKIMKLHGSINWLYCPNCSRLFIHRYKNIGIDYADVCPHCPSNEEKKILLEEMIMTPTMLKELQSYHLRLIWQHAFIELNRADKVVFRGAPKALLKKARSAANLAHLLNLSLSYLLLLNGRNFFAWLLIPNPPTAKSSNMIS